MDIICMNGLMNKYLILGLSLATLWIKGCHRSIGYSKGRQLLLWSWSKSKGVVTGSGAFCYGGY